MHPQFGLGARRTVGGGGTDIIGRPSIIVGYQDIIGQINQLPPAEQAKLMQSVRSQNAYAVTDRDFDKMQTLLLGFFFSQIPNGASQEILVQPQYPFRPAGLYIPSSIAPGFRINNITSGQRPIFAAAGAVPGEAFTEVSNLNVNGVIWATASNGNQISMTVTNRSGAAADFEAMMVGITAVD